MNKGTLPLLIGIVVIAIITVATSFYSASMTGRWGDFQGIAEARAALKDLPLEIGHWKAEAERDLGDTAVNMLRISDSYIFRSYRNDLTQEIVHLTLMVGPTGRITTHTPEICFGGRDYEMESARFRVPIGVQLSSGEEIEDIFWRVDFVGRSLDVNNRISFYWAVSTGGAWNAIENPRWHFRTYRYVYKIQAEAYSGTGEEGDTVRRFLEDCLPTIHEHLHPCQ